MGLLQLQLLSQLMGQLNLMSIHIYKVKPVNLSCLTEVLDVELFSMFATACVYICMLGCHEEV